MSALPHLALVPAKKTVLIVGDNASLNEKVLAALPDWALHTVSSNLTAITAVEKRPFDLIVTNETSSGKDDVQLLRKLRALRAHVRLIILTTETTPADVIASMREGAFSYFSSPYSDESFSEILRIAAEAPSWDDGIEVLAATPEWIRLAARCDGKTADRLLQFIHEITDLPEPEKDHVATAFREMLLNAIEHGAKFDSDQYIEISYLRARHMVLCRVKDPGEGFSLEDIEHAAVANPPDDPLLHQSYRDEKGLRAGGFGMLLARSLVDEVIYSEKGNDVLLIKYVWPEQPKAA